MSRRSEIKERRKRKTSKTRFQRRKHTNDIDGWKLM
jgi:hypothetical protein